MKKYFLPAGMFLSVLMAFLAPGIGSTIKHELGNEPLILIIFFLCGWDAEIVQLLLNRKTTLTFIFGAFIALILTPCLALTIAKTLHLEQMATIGLVVISAVPPTLTSGVVMTNVAKGNTMLAMTTTLGYNVIGVLTMPLMLSLCLRGQADINCSPVTLFRSLCLLVILPFIIGCVLQRLLHCKLPKYLKPIPTACVILLLLSFFSDSANILKNTSSTLLIVSGYAGLLLHGLLLTIIWHGGTLLGFSVEDKKALLFTAGSKTISITLATLAFMNADDGPATVPCMVFYTTQMLLNSCLAASKLL